MRKVRVTITDDAGTRGGGAMRFWIIWIVCGLALQLKPSHAQEFAGDQPAIDLQADDSVCLPSPCEQCCCYDEGLLDNLSLFAGIDGSKQPQDLGVNANLGGRLAANFGMPLLPDYGVGLQLGVAGVFAENAVAVLERVDGTNNRQQVFTTLGIFQRGERWSAGLAYDVLVENYYDNFTLTQWRGRVGYDWNDYNQFGAWFAVRGDDDTGAIGATPVRLQSIDQLNFFWQHDWESGARTTAWVGVAGHHSEAVLVFPENTRTDLQPIIGSSLQVPLNDWLAIYGETNLIMTADSGTVDAFLGFAYYPAGTARAALTNLFAPLQPLAGSPSFAVDLFR